MSAPARVSRTTCGHVTVKKEVSAGSESTAVPTSQDAQTQPPTQSAVPGVYLSDAIARKLPSLYSSRPVKGTTGGHDGRLCDASESTVVSSGDEQDELVQQPTPSASPPASSRDALSRITTSLQTGQPELSHLVSECAQLLQGPTASLCDAAILKIESVMTNEEIMAKILAFHGTNDGLTLDKLYRNTRSAKTSVATARGVDRQEVVDEFKRNQVASGVIERRERSRTARASSTSLEMHAGGKQGSAVMEQIVRPPGVELFLTARTRHRSTESSPRKRKRTPEEKGDEESAAKYKRHDDSAVEEKGDGEIAGTCKGDEELSGKSAEPGHDEDAPKASLLSPRKEHPEPFDPTPHGQPYAGTDLHVPGFRTDGEMSWQKYLAQLPDPRQDESKRVRKQTGRPLDDDSSPGPGL